jgi:hypothetical protein
MTQINPFAGAILQAPEAERLQAADANARARKLQALQKNVAAREGDTFEHQVENTGEVQAINNEEGERDGPPQKQPEAKPEKPAQEDESPLDITG